MCGYRDLRYRMMVHPIGVLIQFCMVLLCMYILSVSLYAQSADKSKNSIADSLKSLLQYVQDTARIDPLIRLTWEYRRNNGIASLRYGREAMELAITYNRPEKFIDAANIVGVVYRSGKDYERALDVFRRIEKVWVGETNKEFAFCKLNIGEMLMYRRLYGVSGAYMNEALRLFTDLRDTIGLAYVALRMGDLYRVQQEYVRAEQEYRRCIDLRRAVYNRDTANIATGYVYMARLLNTRGDYADAIRYVDSAMALADIHRGTFEKNNAYQEKADLLFKQQRYQESIVVAELALNRAQKLSNVYDAIEATTMLRDAWASLKIFDRAYEYSVRHTELIRELSVQKVAFEIESFKLDIEWERRSAESKFNETSQRMQLILKIIGAMIVVVLMGSIFYLMRNARKQASIIRTMEEQRKEIESLRITEREQLWLREGESTAVRIIQESKDVEEMVLRVSGFIAEYVDRSVVSVFVRHDMQYQKQKNDSAEYDRQSHVYEFVGGYAVSSSSDVLRTFSVGEGLCGQAVRNRQYVHAIYDATTSDVQWQSLLSSAGHVTLAHLSAIPCLYVHDVLAVIECAGLDLVMPLQQELLMKIGESIGLALQAQRGYASENRGVKHRSSSEVQI